MGSFLPGCPFCQIAAGQSEALIVGNFQHALAFISSTPATWGHTLVIPKYHVTDLRDLGELANPVFYAVRYMDSKIRKALNPDGMHLIQSTGEAAGQSIQHLCFHLVPRWREDHFGNLWESRQKWLKDNSCEAMRDCMRMGT